MPEVGEQPIKPGESRTEIISKSSGDQTIKEFEKEKRRKIDEPTPTAEAIRKKTTVNKIIDFFKGQK